MVLAFDASMSTTGCVQCGLWVGCRTLGQRHVFVRLLSVLAGLFSFVAQVRTKMTAAKDLTENFINLLASD